jgi:hypothetical protein
VLLHQLMDSGEHAANRLPAPPSALTAKRGQARISPLLRNFVPVPGLPPVSTQTAKRGQARISPLLRNFVPVPGLPCHDPYWPEFAPHYTSFAHAEVQLFRGLRLQLRFDLRLICGWPTGKMAILRRNRNLHQPGRRRGDRRGHGLRQSSLRPLGETADRRALT